MRRPYPSRFKDKAQIMVVKGYPSWANSSIHPSGEVGDGVACFACVGHDRVRRRAPGCGQQARRREPGDETRRAARRGRTPARRFAGGRTIAVRACADNLLRAPPRRRHLGLVLLARDSEAHRDLVRAFAEHHVARLYLALCGAARGHIGDVERPLGPDRSDRRRMRVDAAGRRAVTGFELIARAPHVSLLRLEAATGRTHQLRVHLAHAGHPSWATTCMAGPVTGVSATERCARSWRPRTLSSTRGSSTSPRRPQPLSWF